ncbi:hypothetical protein TSH58p_15035 [Azospirillum sp. TSH58]|uniref:hypothetical protein n=1 Tax=Azospirillum sp. TSH58 TaxID=664962 RepID=UPI000D5FFBFE|nr:hypothetical protein [Azospirillum sp. TSH58]AWJ84724.1 hypothetical protein TSH58p_15035 [Azospirillum sp. TSH58]PWC80891.1 hypothetical protein TSH58_00685 [Azospirillum sp. TSH58]
MDKPDTPNAGAQRLRDAIDKGLTGDKIPASDPAAAPLGTDDEAAGTRPPPTASAQDAAAPDARAPSGHSKGADAFRKGDLPFGEGTRDDG